MRLELSSTVIPEAKCEITLKHPLRGEGEGKEKDVAPTTLLHFFGIELDFDFKMDEAEKRVDLSFCWMKSLNKSIFAMS